MRDTSVWRLGPSDLCSVKHYRDKDNSVRPQLATRQLLWFLQGRLATPWLGLQSHRGGHLRGEPVVAGVGREVTFVQVIQILQALEHPGSKQLCVPFGASDFTDEVATVKKATRTGAAIGCVGNVRLHWQQHVRERRTLSF